MRLLKNKVKIKLFRRLRYYYCPRCNSRHIGKTERWLDKRLLEHSSDFQNSAVAQHFSNRDHVNYLTNLSDLFDNLNDMPPPLTNTSLTYKNP